jgi:plasmid maintenance system antidote protein VapI
MNTIALLEQLKKTRGLASNYALAKYLDEEQSRISKYMNGRITLGDELALRIADELELERGLVLAWIAAERAERSEQPELAKAWQRFAKRAAIAGLVAVGISGAPSPSPASAADTPPCVLCKVPTRRRSLLEILGIGLPQFA